MNNTSIDEIIAGQHAIKSFVLSGGWRKARYVHEPGRGPLGDLLDTYATACETIAMNDPEFASQFGTRFHRERIPSTRLSSHKRKRGPSPPDDGSNNNSGSDLNTSRKSKTARRSSRISLTKGKGSRRAYADSNVAQVPHISVVVVGN